MTTCCYFHTLHHYLIGPCSLVTFGKLMLAWIFLFTKYFWTNLISKFLFDRSVESSFVNMTAGAADDVSVSSFDYIKTRIINSFCGGIFWLLNLQRFQANHLSATDERKPLLPVWHYTWGVFHTYMTYLFILHMEDCSAYKSCILMTLSLFLLQVGIEGKHTCKQ
jgi:hypothetical protein